MDMKPMKSRLQIGYLHFDNDMSGFVVREDDPPNGAAGNIQDSRFDAFGMGRGADLCTQAEYDQQNEQKGCTTTLHFIFSLWTLDLPELPHPALLGSDSLGVLRLMLSAPK
jgi:hypothetical protein